MTNEASGWKAKLELGALVLQIVVLGWIGVASYSVWRTHHMGTLSRPSASTQRPTARVPPVAIAGSPMLGTQSAKIVLIEFSDFECPFCGTFARETLPRIVREYIEPGRVSLVLKFLPLERIHKSSLAAAQAVECAGAQDRLWQMHDAIFADQERLDRQTLLSEGRALGLRGPKFDECLSGRISDRIKRDIEDAKALGIASTPTFLIGSMLPDGRLNVAGRASRALTFDDFRVEFDKLLAH